MKTEHYATRLKRELSEAREENASLRDRLTAPKEFPIFATWYEGHACLHFADRGNERNRSLSGCMDRVEVLHEANRAPVFDISSLSISEILRISDLPLSERVAAYDSLFVPRITREAFNHAQP